MTEFLQQLCNGLSLGAIYALIALGYTMVYGVLRFINFAHGDVFMLGAFAGYFIAPLVAKVFPPGSLSGALVVLVAAMLICAGLGMTIEYLAYRPLRRRPKLTVLITAIGVSLFIEFTCQHRLVFGASPRTFPELLPTQMIHFGGLAVSSAQVVVLVLAFVVFWGMSNGRWRLVGWLVGTVALLAASASLLIPAWPVDNLREVLHYPSYNPPGTPRAAFSEWWPAWGDRLGWALTVIMALFLLIEWVSNRKAEFRGFLCVAYLTMVISQWIGIQTDPGNFVVLFPVLVLVLAMIDERWRVGGRVFVILSLLLLMVGIWAVFLNTIEYGAQPVQSAVMFFPLPAFLFLTLYWVRWWAVQPPSLWYESLEL